ncbi:(Na+)-NQR maturation NqrM [Neptuniibacter sp. CAU 1671]|uniref:(Na+)-NQR maturation NqrM n=1 Tax=Neptuniibacter sp. CAU 1671 TaxID=3032593 RepID=UPI0023DAD532|nr:(Na+)-NQR maturation NqrM [Neptuniibacter sp. CAU 1671]MDF2180819.1 (Na+)-NQR maturation NqrM [Neptuniibacter sp. CAU 1671]
MSTMIFAFVGLLLIVVAMSVGVLLGRKPISGSCGGMANLGIDTSCEICGGDRQKCEEEQEKQSVDKVNADLAYEVKAKD